MSRHSFLFFWHSCRKRRRRNLQLCSLCLPFLRLSHREDNSECSSTLLGSKFSVESISAVGSGERCAFPHATNDVCESILAERFQFFCLFCFDSWEENHGAKRIKTYSGRFRTRASADRYASPAGAKIEKKIQKKATLLVAQYPKTKVWTRCLSQLHTTWAQFFVIVLLDGCRLLETSVAVDRSPKI